MHATLNNLTLATYSALQDNAGQKFFTAGSQFCTIWYLKDGIDLLIRRLEYIIRNML